MLSVLIVVTGLLLMALKSIVDSEPGLIPLLLIVLGTAWYLLTRTECESTKKKFNLIL